MNQHNPSKTVVKATERGPLVVSNRIKKIALPTIGGGLVAAALVAALVVAPSGADFTASDTGRVDVKTATLSVQLSDDKNSVGTFDLDFNNLKPGEVQGQKFYVTNIGSIAAEVKIGQPISGVTFNAPNSGVNGNPAVDPADLLVGVSGITGLTPSTQVPAQIGLGILQPGETKGYTLNFSLDQSAGNEWQDATVGSTYTVTLEQQ